MSGEAKRTTGNDAEGLFVRVVGEGRPVLFLHGLGGSGRYWADTFDNLSTSHRLGYADLAGFGRSITVPGPYDLDGHLGRLRQACRAWMPGDGLVVVGHSFGAVLALAASAAWPEVSAVMCFGLPAYRNPAEARECLRNLGPMERWLVAGAWPARAACWAVCNARPAARLLAPLWARGMPRAVARDSVEHTWAAYAGGLSALVEDADVGAWVQSRAVPRMVLQGDQDRVCPPSVLRDVLGGLDVDLRVLAGDHHLPLFRADKCLDAVRELLASG